MRPYKIRPICEAPEQLVKFYEMVLTKRQLPNRTFTYAPNVLPAGDMRASCLDGNRALYASGGFGFVRLDLLTGACEDMSYITEGAIPDALSVETGYLWAVIGDRVAMTTAAQHPFGIPAADKPVKLQAFKQKRMKYYPAGDSRVPAAIIAALDASAAVPQPPPGGVGLPEIIGRDNTTCWLRDGDIIVIGTKNGAIRIAPKEKDLRDVVMYFDGPRYLLHGDDCVTGIAADGTGGFYLRNSKGITHVYFADMTFAEKCKFYEDTTHRHFDYRRAIIDGKLSTSDYGNTGEYDALAQYSTNNDCFWTVLYCFGEFYRYQVLLKQNKTAEAAAVKHMIKRHLEHIILLARVHRRGDGFIARCYQAKNDPIMWDADKKTVRQGSLWFEYNPADNCFYVLDTKQARDGNRVHERGYPAYSLSPEKKAELGVDRTFPYEEDADGTVWRLPSPVNEAIPARLMKIITEADDIHPGRYPGNKLEDIIYKADASSEEVIAAFAMYAYAHKYLLDPNDPDDADLHALMTETAVMCFDHLLRNDYLLRDATGRATEWGKWSMDYFSTFEKLEDDGGEFPLYAHADGPLNAAEMAAMALTVRELTANYPQYRDKHAQYAAEYNKMFDQSPDYATNGQGNAWLFVQYIQRCMRSTSAMAAMSRKTAGTMQDTEMAAAYARAADFFDDALRRNDHSLVINYSDEELCMYAFLPLFELETDPTRLAIIRAGYAQWFDNMARQGNAWYTFFARILSPGDPACDIDAALWQMKRYPEMLIRFPSKASLRRDVVRYTDPERTYDQGRDRFASINRMLPYDERRGQKINGSPFIVDEGINADGSYAAFDYNKPDAFVGSFYTTPYWMGVYYGVIEE